MTAPSHPSYIVLDRIQVLKTAGYSMLAASVALVFMGNHFAKKNRKETPS